MASLNMNFDAETVAPAAPRELLPAGKYPVEIVASEMKATKRGDGQYLSLEMTILDGEYAGRKLFDNLNLQNPNQDAVDIAKRALSAICHAIGKMQVSDSEELHFRPLVATVKVDPAKGEYGPSNKVSGYEPANKASAPRASAPAGVVAQAQTKPAGSMPWNRPAA